MASIILALRCQHCGAFLPKPDWEDSDDHILTCIICARRHNEDGQLLIPEVKYQADWSDRRTYQGIDNRR